MYQFIIEYSACLFSLFFSSICVCLFLTNKKKRTS
jgi:hypothetical protein